MRITLTLLMALSTLSLFAQNKPNGLAPGATAPLFTAKDQHGKLLELKNELKKGSVVLVFYRGEWCPFCNKELKALEDSLQFIKAKGAEVIAISPEMPQNLSKTVEKTKASYPLVSDEGLKIMKSYDVAFKVDSLTVSKYRGYGVAFDKANGANGANLPVPAVYVINKKGKIIYRYFDADYRKRPSVKEILSQL